MQLSPFHALYTARQLAEHAFGTQRLVPAYASSDIEVYPYQIASAIFALRSPYLKGAVLADEGSLGKTYEALLIVSQLWFEGRDRILIIVPTPLLRQWAEILDNQFSVPYAVVERDDCNIDTDAVFLTTYEIAVEHSEQIAAREWNIVVFEEAHRLAKSDSKISVVLHEATGDAFKLLMTATPMQNSIMDLYGLIEFIDPGALGDKDEFYKRYFRKPENYGELTATANRYCFRTLRSQVKHYVKIPRRIPVTTDYTLSKKEAQLQWLVDAYLEKPNKQAFPKMERYDLTLLFNRAMASSPFALSRLADTAVGRVREPELVEIAALAAEISPKSTGKGQQLLKALKLAFAQLKKRGASRKAIIFTGSSGTLGFLHVLLSEEFDVLAFDGSKSSDYSVIKKFEAEADILITTDIAAEGFNLAFCSFVVNYDLPYNVLTLEQRIMRCHWQGQQNDVLVLNFLNKQNFTDVRMLELINKRVLQFDGIMGMSDDVVGNFCDAAADGLAAAFEQVRHRKDIEAEFQATLAAHEEANSSAVEAAENALLTTFTRDVAAQVTVTPQYIKDRAAETRAKLWELTRWFFAGRQGYWIDEDMQTLHVGIQPEKVFTGTALRRTEYSIGDKTLSPASAIARNIIKEMVWRGVPESGTVTVEGLAEPCTLAFYRIGVQPKDAPWTALRYDALVGKSSSGRALAENECKDIMALPVVEFTVSGQVRGDRDGAWQAKPHELDIIIDAQAFVRRAAADTSEARREEMTTITQRALREKSLLGREVESLKNELRQIDNALGRTGSVAERVDAEKRRATTSRELKQREQSLYMDRLRIDAQAEAAVQALADEAGFKVEIKRLFAVEFTGDISNGK